MAKFTTSQQIKFWLDTLKIEHYTIHPDLSVDVAGNVGLNLKRLTELPVKFGVVTGDFDCAQNQLTSLNGAPHTVGGNFDCSNNDLSSLKWSPDTIEGHLIAHDNHIGSLKYCPPKVGGAYELQYNDLTSLEGAPEKTQGDFWVFGNKLKNLQGSPGYVGGEFDCSLNDLTSLVSSPRIVMGDFICSQNDITGFKNVAIEHIEGNFDCTYNQIIKINLDEDTGKLPFNFTGLFLHKVYEKPAKEAEIDEYNSEYYVPAKEKDRMVYPLARYHDLYVDNDLSITQADLEYRLTAPLSEQYEFHRLKNREKIEEWLESIGISIFMLDDNLEVTVPGNVNLARRGLEFMPVQFREVRGSFLCEDNALLSLKGVPPDVLKDFNCAYNNLTTLEYSPITVGGDYNCQDNELSSLQYMPEVIGKNLNCADNPITDFDNFNFFCGGKIKISLPRKMEGLEKYYRGNVLEMDYVDFNTIRLYQKINQELAPGKESTGKMKI